MEIVISVEFEDQAELILEQLQELSESVLDFDFEAQLVETNG